MEIRQCLLSPFVLIPPGIFISHFNPDPGCWGCRWIRVGRFLSREQCFTAQLPMEGGSASLGVLQGRGTEGCGHSGVDVGI